MICIKCSAEARINCTTCGYHYCKLHAMEHDHLRGTAVLEELIEGTLKSITQARRQLMSRGDFAVDIEVKGAQGEKRYFLCGPDDANQGITLNNLRAVWHLIGQVIEDES